MQIDVIDIDSELELSQPRQDLTAAFNGGAGRGAESERALAGKLHVHW